MIDNGLLKKYFENKNTGREGAIFKTQELPKRGAVPMEIKISKSTSGIFYFKRCRVHRSDDAEILLSQLCAKYFNINTAIYLPATLKSSSNEKVSGVISNDVRCGVTPNIENTLHAYDYGRVCLPYNKSDMTEYVQSQNALFSRECIRNIVKMRLFDVGALNDDRHSNNFFYQIDADNKAVDIALIDYGFSANGYCDYNLHNGSDGCFYYNDFLTDKDDGTEKNRNKMVDNFKHNESMQEYITPRELVETLEQVDVKATARDIYDTIGYKVGEEYVDTIAESFENLAEEVSRA